MVESDLSTIYTLNFTFGGTVCQGFIEGVHWEVPLITEWKLL
ncbi:TPA: hypothetical protein ACXNW8_001323 [Clostridium botulinum]